MRACVCKNGGGKYKCRKKTDFFEKLDIIIFISLHENQVLIHMTLFIHKTDVSGHSGFITTGHVRICSTFFDITYHDIKFVCAILLEF